MSRSIAALITLAWLTFAWTTAPADHEGHARPAASIADTLKNPPLLKNQSAAPRTIEVSLPAAPGRLALMPGKVTDVYAFNGSVPGPTLEVREGDRVIVHYTNNLPESSGIHWHGLHLPANMDGSPLFP